MDMAASEPVADDSVADRGHEKTETKGKQCNVEHGTLLSISVRYGSTSATELRKRCEMRAVFIKKK